MKKLRISLDFFEVEAMDHYEMKEYEGGSAPRAASFSLVCPWIGQAVDKEPSKSEQLKLLSPCMIHRTLRT